MRFTSRRCDLYARQAQPIFIVSAVKPQHPEAEAREPGLTIQTFKVIPFELDPPISVGSVLLGQQRFTACKGSPGDVPDRISRTVFS